MGRSEIEEISTEPVEAAFRALQNAKTASKLTLPKKKITASR